MTIVLQTRDRFLIRQIIWQHETINTWRHAILCRFVAEFDDFLDNFGFAFIQSPFLLSLLNQRPQLLAAQARTSAQMRRGEKIDNIRAAGLESVTDTVEKRHRYLQRESTNRRKPKSG